MFALPRYEMKFCENDDWIEITDVELMNQLYKTFRKVSPVIKEMLTGNEVKTSHGIYRLKIRGGEA